MGDPSRTTCLAWLFSLGLPLCQGCSNDADNTCSSGYLPDIIDFTFTPAIAEAGDYEISMDAPPVSGSCHVVVGGKGLEPCSSARMTLNVDMDEVVTALSGLQVWFDYAPPTIEFAVKSTEATLVSQLYEPVYVAEAPEGPGCQNRLHATIPVGLP